MGRNLVCRTPHITLRLILMLPVCLGVKRNVLFIMADDARPELGCYGGQAKTPNLDKLSTLPGSTRFSHVYSQQALCGPSRTSMLNSRRPDTVRTWSNSDLYWRRRCRDCITLPQWFKSEANYTTISLGKIFHPGHISNQTDDYPLSWSYPPYHPSTFKYKNSKTCPDPASGRLEADIVCPVNVSTQPEQTLPDIQIAEEALIALKQIAYRQIDERKPWFLAVGFMKPHIPLKYPKKFNDLYPIEDIKLAPDRKKQASLPPIAWNPFMSIKRRHDVASLNISFPYGAVPDYFQKRMIQSYLASLSYIDSLVGQILDFVQSDPILSRDTLIAFTSDHGWQLGENGEWEKYSNFQTATRVPLIIRNPTSDFPSNVVDEYVELLDVFPTIVEAATGVQLPTCTADGGLVDAEYCVHGKSLYPSMERNRRPRSGNRPQRPTCNLAVTQYPRPTVKPSLDSDQPRLPHYMGYSIVSPTFRYTRWVPFNATNGTADWMSTISQELYNTTSDPGECNNLIGRIPLIEMCVEIQRVCKKCHDRELLYQIIYNITYSICPDEPEMLFPSLFWS